MVPPVIEIFFNGNGYIENGVKIKKGFFNKKHMFVLSALGQKCMCLALLISRLFLCDGQCHGHHRCNELPFLSPC